MSESPWHARRTVRSTGRATSKGAAQSSEEPIAGLPPGSGREAVPLREVHGGVDGAHLILPNDRTSLRREEVDEQNPVKAIPTRIVALGIRVKYAFMRHPFE